MYQEKVISRIWAFDHTVWSEKPDEITNRLGWLYIGGILAEQIPDLQAFVDSVRHAGLTHALLLGMGGSSLAPEVFRRTFGVKSGYQTWLCWTAPTPMLCLRTHRALT
jgi:hypothetical protein